MRFVLEQGTGIEPAFTAWEAVVLPIYEPCSCEGIIAEDFQKFNCFLSFSFLQSPFEKAERKNGCLFSAGHYGFIRAVRTLESDKVAGEPPATV